MSSSRFRWSAGAAPPIRPRQGLYIRQGDAYVKGSNYVDMPDVKSPRNPVWLPDEEVRQGIELLFFAYRDFTASPMRFSRATGFAAPIIE